MLILGILISSLIFFASIRFSPISYLEPLSSFLHAECLYRLPQNSRSLPELKALVCAENFAGLYISEVFVTSGVIHLFVVSGAHLLVIQKIFEKLAVKLPKKFERSCFVLIFIFLFIYAAACEFNSPVTRSLIAILLASFLYSRHLLWPRHFILLLVGLMTLLFDPHWLQSISLQLSWLAAFIMALNQDFFKERSFLFKQSLYFFALLPLLIFFHIPSPLAILINLVFTPLLEFVLFPLGLLVWLFPPVYVVFDFLMDSFKYLLSQINISWQFQPSAAPSWFITFNWFLILTLHFFTHLIWLKRKRAGST